MARKLRNLFAALTLAGVMLFQMNGCSFAADELVGLDTVYTLAGRTLSGSSDAVTKHLHPTNPVLVDALQ
jgi:hypothetical protein